MFKSLFALLKSIFITVEDITGVVDNAVDFALLHTECWVLEALAENKAKAEELQIDPEYKAEKLKAIRKSSRTSKE
jgi:hypothetical protein